jgi:hypothetical protein
MVGPGPRHLDLGLGLERSLDGQQGTEARDMLNDVEALSRAIEQASISTRIRHWSTLALTRAQQPFVRRASSS